MKDNALQLISKNVLLIEDYITTVFVSKLLRCSDEYVRKMAHKGEIRYQKNGKNMIFKKSDILRYINENF